MIDVSDRVISTIQSRKYRVPANRKLWIAALTGALLLVCGFGYAAVSWQLHRHDGTISLEYRAFEPGDSPPEKQLATELKKSLNIGEAAVFYIRRKERDQIVSLENPVEYSSLELLRSKIELPIRLPEKLPGSYAFREGGISHKLEEVGPETIESLREEAVRLNADKVMKKLAVKGFLSVYLQYRDAKGGSISVSAWPGEMWRKIYSNLQQEDAEKVMISGHEALATNDRTTGERQVFWIDERNGVPIYYLVSTSTPGLVTKEDLLVAAGSL